MVCDVLTKVLVCDLKVNRFEIQARYFIIPWINTLKKGMNPLNLTELPQVVSLFLVNKDMFGLKNERLFIYH